jgi:hypothetical protein
VNTYAGPEWIFKNNSFTNITHSGSAGGTVIETAIYESYACYFILEGIIISIPFLIFFLKIAHSQIFGMYLLLELLETRLFLPGEIMYL